MPFSSRQTLLEKSLAGAPPPKSLQIWGEVSNISGQALQVTGLSGAASLGQLVRLDGDEGQSLTGEVIALSGPAAIIMMHQNPQGLHIGQKAYLADKIPICPSDGWIGQVLNYQGRTFSGARPPAGKRQVKLAARPPQAINRKALGTRLETGLAPFDTFLPLCRGQRMGLFAGSGIGKSSLLAQLARGSNADINVLALIGERGREVRSFVDHSLGPKGMEKSIVFVATSDMPAALKLRTAQLSMAAAEYFRDEGRQVLYLCDSLTRYAEAHRDMALTAGEVPSLRAYPPSTFRALASLCERAGPGPDGKGDITAIFSVLVAGSNMEEPVADMVRGIMDGHVILTREIAERGRYPAIDIRRSISRSLPDAASEAENKILARARAHIGRYEEARPLIQSGLYVSGSDAALDESIILYPALDAFISRKGQGNIENSFSALAHILDDESGPNAHSEPEPELERSDQAGQGARAQPTA